MLSKTVSPLGLKICYPKRQLSEEAGCQRSAISAWGRCGPGEQWNHQSTALSGYPKKPHLPRSFTVKWIRAGITWKQPPYLQNTLSLAWPASFPPTARFWKGEGQQEQPTAKAKSFYASGRLKDQTPKAPFTRALFQISESGQELLWSLLVLGLTHV